MLATTIALLAFAQNPMATWPNSKAFPNTPGEKHLRNVRQLTFGGDNAEAYWSVDGTKIVFQSRQPNYPDEQIYVMNADGSGKRLVSTGKGRCTCSYFTPDGKFIYFSSTFEKNPGAQPSLDMSLGYVWMVNPQFSLYRVNVDGTGLTKIMDKNEYLAETTIAPNGKYMTFTGAWEGDLEIYRANLDGTRVRRLTHHEGYDGGPFVSWDSKWITYRRDRIDTPAEAKDFHDLLDKHLVRPSKLEIMLMDSEGRNQRQITDLDCASFAPFLTPDSKRIIFSSNFGDPKGREFELWMIGVDGHGLERITRSPEFDGFPMFSRDGKKLVFASNRGGSNHETDIFVADWVE
ncbi:MAG: PD40 domain-containing protein [Chthonomonadaceae bacterium]|nr:PD40 domain-containing protein [Chthonomonadaceae bacterium]